MRGTLCAAMLAAALSAQPVPRREPPFRTPSAPQDQSVGRKAETVPKLLENRPPIYPAQAVLAHWEETVLLRVHVERSSDAGEVEIYVVTAFVPRYNHPMN